VDHQEGAENYLEYTRGEEPSCACGGTGWVHTPNSPDHPCPRCLSRTLRGMKGEHIYTSSMHSLMMPEEF